MHIVSLNQWGNSLGLRVPSALAKHIQAQVGEAYSVQITQSGDLIYSPIKEPRANWTEALNAFADATYDNPSENDPFNNISNEFDDKEWTW
jgi:antitoxin component of MazEF toxin-antitoxin module